MVPRRMCFRRGGPAWSGAFIGALLLGVAWPGGPCRGDTFDAGPLYTRDRALQGSDRVRAAGPLVEFQAGSNDWLFAAFRPFFARVTDPVHARDLREYGWPLCVHRRNGKDTYFRFLLTFYVDPDNRDARSRYRLSVLPFYFQGRGQDGRGYAALFPLGGVLYDYLSRDEIRFLLFPLYAYHRINELETREVLWPVGSWTRGDGKFRWRVFPFYGYAHEEGKWTKRFVLWPFWNQVRYEYPDQAGRGWVLFPLAGHVVLPDQETWMLLPPLFRWTRSERQTKLHGPWPFVQYGAGQTDRLYLWPLFGRRASGGVTSEFAAWPFLWRQTAERDGITTRRDLALPFWYHERTHVTATDGAPTEVRDRHTKLWPFYSYRREGDRTRLRLPEPWPFREMAPIERNLAPLWTLYTAEKVGAAFEHELLWGMYRFRRDADGACRRALFPLVSDARAAGRAGRRVRWLLGLVTYERDEAGARLRMCGMHVAGARETGKQSW